MRQRILDHLYLIIPLAISSLLQRCEHLLDNRFVGVLGLDAVAVHSVYYYLFMIGQAISLASATGLLIFWKNINFKESQFSVLKTFLLFGFVASSIIGFGIFLSLPFAIPHFKLIDTFAPYNYLFIGILSMILQVLFGIIQASLIGAGMVKHFLIDLISKWEGGSPTIQ